MIHEISNEKIIKHVIPALDEINKNMLVIDTRNKQSLDSYRAVFTSDNNEAYSALQSRVFLPMAHRVVMQKLPRILQGVFPEPMPVKCTHTGLEDIPVAAAHHETIRHQIIDPDQTNLRAQFKKFLLDGLISTHALALLEWSSNKHCLEFRPIDQHDCRFAPGTIDMNETAYWITRRYVGQNAIKERIRDMSKYMSNNARFFACDTRIVDKFPTASMSNEKIHPYAAEAVAGKDVAQASGFKDDDTSDGSVKYNTADPNDTMVEVITYRTPTHFVEFVRLTGKEWGNTSKKPAGVCDGGAVILRYDNPFSEIGKNGKPEPGDMGVVGTCFEPLPQCAIGMSPIGLTEHLNKTANTFLNLAIDNKNKTVNAIYVVNDASGIDDKDLVFKPGAVIHSMLPAASSIQSVIPPNVTGNAIPDINWAISQMKEDHGLTPYQQGMNEQSGRTPVGAIDRLLAQGDMPINEQIRMCRELLKRIVKRMMWCNERWLPEEYSIRRQGAMRGHFIKIKRARLRSRAGIDVIVEDTDFGQDRIVAQQNLAGILQVLPVLQQMGIDVQSKINPDGLMRFVMRSFTTKTSEIDEIFKYGPEMPEAMQLMVATECVEKVSRGESVLVHDYYDPELHLQVAKSAGLDTDEFLNTADDQTKRAVGMYLDQLNARVSEKLQGDMLNQHMAGQVGMAPQAQGGGMAPDEMMDEGEDM